MLLTLSLFYLTDSLIYHVKTHDFYDDVANNTNLLNRMDTSNLSPDHRCYTLARMKLPGYFKDEISGRNMRQFIGLRAKSYAYDIEGVVNIRSKGVRGHVIRNHLTFDDHMRCLFADDDGSDADDYRDKEFDASTGRLIARDCARIVIKRIHRNAVIAAIPPTTTQHPPSTPPPPPSPPPIPTQQQSYMTYTAYRENISIRSYKHQVSTIRTSKLVLNRFDDKRHILPNRIDTLAHGHYRID